jgi:hypothetical protein
MLLAEFGIGYKRVAKLAGVSITAARSIIWGRQDPGPRYGELPKRVKRENAERLLSVKPTIDALAGGALIPARGTHRRVQALVARGWSQSQVSKRLGMERANFWVMMQQSMVSVRRHREVAALFEQLWNVAPPQNTHAEKVAYSRSLHYAQARR